MPTVTPPTATCHVLTYKQGVLSAIAHDLRIRVERFTIEIDDAAEQVEARFEAHSLRVDCAMKGGHEARSPLREGQKRDIESNIVEQVLHARRYPTIVFRSAQIRGEGNERRISGTLTLHGVERPIEATARRADGRWTAEVSIHQPDFGIEPYSAMLGALKIQPVVRVRVSVPA
ncbi:MAG: YceI family protein [Myxococcota bacterium]